MVRTHRCALRLLILFFLGVLGPSGAARAAIPTDWTTPVTPFKIAGNLFYVGSRELGAYLIVTPEGNILLNANLPSSPAQIRRSVEALGFRWSDTRILLISQAHYDHVGGAAEVAKQTGAKVMVMDGDVPSMESGGAADFDQTLPHFAPVHVDRTLHDADAVTLGGTTLTAHKTAGHTPGCTTWTMQVPGDRRALDVVVVGGWAVNNGVRLVPGGGRSAAYPTITQDLDRTFATLKALPCDIFLGAHGAYFDLLPKRARLRKEGSAVWVDPAGYRMEVLEEEASYRTQLARQQSSTR